MLTADRQARRLAMMDFPTPVEAFTRMRIPKNFNGRNPQCRRDLASTLRARTHDLTPPPRTGGRRRRLAAPSDWIGAARSPAAAPSCARTRATTARTARTTPAGRSGGSSSTGTPRTLKRRIEQRTNTIARQFDRVCDVLTALGYLEGDEVTERGRHLMRIYTDMDLVAAESLRHGLWDELSPRELAAALSALVFETRRPTTPPSPRMPGGRVKQALGDMVSLWAELDALEREHKLDFLREPDLGFAWAAYRWAEGDALDDVLGTDRPRRRRLRPLGQAAARPDRPGRRRGRGHPAAQDRARGVRRLRRGVVAYSSVAD